MTPGSGLQDKRPSRALLALVLLVPAPSAGVLAGLLWRQGGGAGGFPPGQAVYLLSKLWLVGFPTAWWLLVDKGRPGWSPPRRGGLGAGAGLGAGIAAVIVLAYVVFGRAAISPEALETFRGMAARNRLDEPARYLALAVFICTINAVVEEYVWRWFVFRKCEALLPAVLAVPASAALFTAHHVIALGLQLPWHVALLASLGVFIGGLVWSWCYLRYRSIWPGCVSHMIVDVAVFAIGWNLLFG